VVTQHNTERTLDENDEKKKRTKRGIRHGKMAAMQNMKMHEKSASE
jgi:hypothetical protein